MKIRIDGVEYQFPSFDTLSYREARRIKKETGLVMGQFFTALEQGDPDALLAVALIAKLRDNPAFKVEDLYDLQLDEIEIVTPPAPPEEDPRPLWKAAPMGATTKRATSRRRTSAEPSRARRRRSGPVAVAAVDGRPDGLAAGRP
jgi:hypothetical protein